MGNRNAAIAVKYIIGAIAEIFSFNVYRIDDGAYISETYAVTANYNGGIYRDTIQRTTRVGGGSGNLLTGIKRSSGYIVAKRSRGFGGKAGKGIAAEIK